VHSAPPPVKKNPKPVKNRAHNWIAPKYSVLSSIPKLKLLGLFFKLFYPLLKECRETIPKQPRSHFAVYLAAFTIPSVLK